MSRCSAAVRSRYIRESRNPGKPAKHRDPGSMEEKRLDEQTRQTADELVSYLAPLEGTAKAMFGGYCVYIDEKVAGLVCDGRIFVKQTPATKSLDGWADQAPAYPGAKDSWRLPSDALI